MWRPLQVIWEARLPRRLHEGWPMRLYLNLISHNYSLLDTPKTSICALHSRICVARYGSNCCNENVLLWLLRFRQPCDLRNVHLPGGGTFSCQERCSIPTYFSSSSSSPLSFRPIVFFAANKSTSHILAIIDSVKCRASSANIFVSNLTFTGSPLVRITCVGQCTTWTLLLWTGNNLL